MTSGKTSSNHRQINSALSPSFSRRGWGGYIKQEKIINLIKHYAILIILLLALALRLININQPLQTDEAFIGYTGYSILETSKDITGSHYPLILTFLFEKDLMQENVILSYLDIPFIKIFGLSEIAVRLPMIIISLLSIYLIYKLTNLLTNKTTAVASALIYSISSWSLIIAQTALNPFLLPFLYLLAVYLFILGIKQQKSIYIIISTIPLALTFYSFNASILWTPFLILLLVYSFFKQIPKKTITILISSVIILILPLPFYLMILISHTHFIDWQKILSILPINIPIITTTRFDQLSIFTNHQGIFILLAFIFNYLIHLSLIFFFIEPFPKYAVFPHQLGLLEWYLLPLIMTGLWFCFKNRQQIFYKILLIIFLTYPLLPSFIDSVPTIHPTRDIMILPWIYIVAAIGFNYLWQKFLTTPTKKIIFLTIITLNIFFSLTIYFTNYGKYNYNNQYINKELINYLKTVENNYNKIIIITSNKLTDVQYNNLAFYLQYNPDKLQQELKLYDYQKLGKYEWQPAPGPTTYQPDALYIFNKYATIPQANVIKKFYQADGKLVFQVAKF